VKPPSPLLGFNNNVRHKGRVFHIQTEDSGVRHPHIITHLFADGGRILKTTKTSYAEFLDTANMGEVVRQMMQDQHKAMFMALRDGQFDHLVEELPSRGSGPGQRAPAAAAAPPATSAAPAVSGPSAIGAAMTGAPATVSGGSPALGPSVIGAPPASSGAGAIGAIASASPAAVSAQPSATSAASLASTGPLSTRDVRGALSREPASGPPPLPLVNPLGHAPTMPSVPAVQPRVAPEISVPPSVAQPPVAPLRAPAASPTVASAVSIPTAPPIAIFPSVPPVPGASSPPLSGSPQAPSQAPLRAPSMGPQAAPVARAPASPPPPAPAALVSRPTPTRMASARPRLDIDPAAIHRAPELEHSSTLASVVEATVEGGTGIDLDTLERAAAEAETPLFQQIRDLPPPPAAVIGARTPSASPGGYSSVAPPLPPASAPPSTRGRYAPSRPSSIFASVRPQEGASIFGEDLISEKSLDEVILSYLAEDLDGEKK